MKCKELFDKTYNDAKQYCDDPDDTLESAKSQLLNIDYLRFIDADNDLDKVRIAQYRITQFVLGDHLVYN